MLDIDKIAASLFEKIRSKFENVSVGDEKAKATTVPGKARFFNFDYISSDNDNFGNISISIVDTKTLKVTYSRSISGELDDAQKQEWYDFLRDLRMFAKRNMMSFVPHDISRKGLGLKDLKQMSDEHTPDAAASVSESKLYGSTKTSYESVAPGTRLIIRHSASVDESVHGARSRKIQSVYVEDAEGQRFKMPTNNLAGARAIGQHIAHGGQIYDDFGKHTSGLVQEMAKIKKFIQGSRNKTFEDHEASEMVNAAKERYHEIHRILHHIKGPRGYAMYKESWTPGPELDDQGDVDMESLRGKFTQKKFDDRLEEALPFVYQAYSKSKGKNMPQITTAIDKQVNEFAQVLSNLEEGTWALPKDELEIQKLQELMASPLIAGIDGNDASAALYDILGDDMLFDHIYDASKGSPEMDVRPVVYDWLMKNMPSVGAKIDAELKGGGDGDDPAAEEPAPDSGEQPPQQPTESAVNHNSMLVDLRRLSGIN